MARVPEELVRRLKREVSIERLVEASGVELSRHGSDRIGLCPFHDDTEPSLVVTPSKNLWHCLGACNVGGSVIDWVMKAEGVSFRHAVELLREGLAPAVSGEGPPPKVSTVRRLESPVSAEASERELLGQVAAYYHGVLRESAADARDYLAERGVGDEEAIERFELGFADRTLGLRLEAKTRKAGAELRSRLERLGVYRESGHEHLTGCVVFPIHGGDGAVVNLYGRRIGKLSRGAPSHLYLPGPRRGLWNREASAARNWCCASR
jgi:DNA primase catalytic core